MKFHRKVFIFVMLILVNVFICGCSKNMGEQNASERSHELMSAAAGMTQGAQIGSKSHWSEVYHPSPNAYVGKLLFEQYCSGCHSDGKQLISSSGTGHRDVASDYYIIVYGQKLLGNDMPGFRTRLTQFQIYDVLSYLNYDVENSLKSDYSGFKNTEK